MSLAGRGIYRILLLIPLILSISNPAWAGFGQPGDQAASLPDAFRGPRLQPAAATYNHWSSLGGAGTGLNGSVHDIEFDGGVLYAGGEFTNAGGDADAYRIAKFSGAVWSSLGGAGYGFE